MAMGVIRRRTLLASPRSAWVRKRMCHLRHRSVRLSAVSGEKDGELAWDIIPYFDKETQRKMDELGDMIEASTASHPGFKYEGAFDLFVEDIAREAGLEKKGVMQKMDLMGKMVPRLYERCFGKESAYSRQFRYNRFGYTELQPAHIARIFLSLNPTRIFYLRDLIETGDLDYLIAGRPMLLTDSWEKVQSDYATALKLLSECDDPAGAIAENPALLDVELLKNAREKYRAPIIRDDPLLLFDCEPLTDHFRNRRFEG